MKQHQIYTEAAEWIIKIQQKTLDDIDQAKFEQWKAQSSMHQAAWSKAERLLNSVAEFPEDGHSLIEQANKNAQFNMSKILVIACLFGFAGLVAWNSDYKYQWLSDYSTSVGQQKQVELEDGTQLQLNTHSAVDVRYTVQQRALYLYYGEIQVQTAKEKNTHHRPFFVKTESANLQALGTVFNVQYLKDNENQTCLGVIESAVKVTLKQSKQTKIIHAGEQLCFDEQRFDTLTPLDPNILAWKNHMVMAFEMPVDELIKEIGRYQHQYIDIDPQLKSLKISGSYPVNDFKTLKTALELSYPIKVESYFGDHVLSIQSKTEKREK
jgi:transmembrane sensor